MRPPGRPCDRLHLDAPSGGGTVIPHFAVVLAFALASGAAPEGLSARAPELDDAARLLAGLEVASGSRLARLAAEPWAVARRGRTDATWSRYRAEVHEQVERWAAAELGDAGEGPVFYPFSGPDLLNPLVLFPRATTITMLGLEPVGPIPRASDPPATQRSRAEQAERALRHILQRNYFITDTMAVQLGRGRADVGVAALLALFAVRTGHEITGAREIALGPTGEVVDRRAAKGGTTGLELRLRDAGVPGAETVVRYFPVNLDDAHFAQAPGLTAHLEAQGRLTTLLKAASYLTYQPAFDDVRGFVVARSGLVVTESSGLPFHALDRPGWEIRLYGAYANPIADFADQCQPDLREAIARRTRGPLPFPFGYEFRTANHAVVARRAATNPIATPAYDRTTHAGVLTRCVEDQLVVRRVGPGARRGSGELSLLSTGDGPPEELWGVPDPELQRLVLGVIHRSPEFERARGEGRFSLALVDLVDPTRLRAALVDPDREAFTASLSKIAVLLGVVSKARATGRPAVLAGLRGQLVQMIKYSSNVDAIALYRWAGFAAVRDALLRHRLYDDEHGGLWWTLGDGRDPPSGKGRLAIAGTARQVARFFLLMEQGRLVSPADSRVIKDVLHDAALAVFGKGIKRTWPEAEYYGKPGILDSAVAEGMLIEAPGARYVLAVLAQGIDHRDPAFLELGRDLHAAMLERAGVSPLRSAAP